jgi:heavy metal translocating P-type ATPase
VASGQEEVVLDIDGMTCASCVAKVERAIGSVEGVDGVVVNLTTRTARVQASPDREAMLFDAVRSAGYRAHAHEGIRDPAEEARSYLRRLFVAVSCTVPVLWLTFGAAQTERNLLLAWAFATPVVLWAGWPFFASAARAARHSTVSMDTLIALGAGAAYGYSVVSIVVGDGAQYLDTASVIITLILLGKVLEARARSAAGDASRTLLQRGAKEATVLVDGRERRVSIDELRPGQLAVVMPGAKVPADGVVKEGTSWVDLSLLTGESEPVDVGPGDEVVGASINGFGRLVVFVTSVGSNTRLAEIVRLLEAAQGSKAPVQRLADKISSIFVPIVLAIALATFVGWMVFSSVDATTALLHSIAVVLIACPCALGLATPAAITAGTGRAAELGILFKGGEVFERIRGADVVVLDKTGTVTQGAMTLVGVTAADGEYPNEVLAIAASVEAGSDHPIAVAVIEGARARSVSVPQSTGHAITVGAGASATIEGAMVRVGRPDGLPPALCAAVAEASAAGLTTVGVWRDGDPVGTISVSDSIRPDAVEAVSRMRSLGLEIELVSGDRQVIVDAIADEVGIARTVAEATPEAKVEEVRRLQSEGRRVIVAGDGINDAPALAAATVGIAMGTGTDVALAAADVNLLGGSLASVADALAIARRSYRIIRQNLFWAFAYNVVMIPLAVLGILTPMWAAAAMALSSVTVVANALRLRRFRSGVRT